MSSIFSSQSVRTNNINNVDGNTLTLDAGAGNGDIYIGQNSVEQEGSIFIFEELYIQRITDPNPLVGTAINFSLEGDTTILNLCASVGSSSNVNIGGSGSQVKLYGGSYIGINDYSVGGFNDTFVSVASTDNQNAMRFHSNKNFNRFSSSIVSTGGTAVANEGALEITAKTITLTGQVSISASGTIPTPDASTVRVLQAFGTTFTSTLPPKVYLTYDAGATSTNIITVCLAGFGGVANAWTGFYYLTSTSSAGVADSKLNWVAIA
jgi:hypothetical protein